MVWTSIVPALRLAGKRNLALLPLSRTNRFGHQPRERAFWFRFLLGALLYPVPPLQPGSVPASFLIFSKQDVDYRPYFLKRCIELYWKAGPSFSYCRSQKKLLARSQKRGCIVDVMEGIKDINIKKTQFRGSARGCARM